MPTGLLAVLPLHAAGRGRESVLDRTISSYTPTIKLLAACRSRRLRGPGKAVLVAVPDAPGLPPLPGTSAEAYEVMQRFPDAEIAGPDTPPEDLLAGVGTCGWLHIACHASSFANDPASSALHLYGGDITVKEVMAVGAPDGKLAYLSACATVLADMQLADEVIHLGSAFLTAGFQHVIGTLWRVTDGTAAETTRLFYAAVGTSEDQAALV